MIKSGSGNDGDGVISGDDHLSLIVDEELANIVLVKKEEMEEWRKK